MVRLIKRYGGGSRKLYDTEEARYVSLDEVGRWVRDGQRLRVVDAKSDEDVTAQTLAQVILEEERRGVSRLPTELFHDIIRRGERALSRGVEQIQSKVGHLVEQVKPLHEARTEMDVLRRRLDELERSLAAMEGRNGGRKARARPRGAKRVG
jgi:polyhydroxyalkanoate synthesis repressor PhaR